jgi:hypothetical protein
MSSELFREIEEDIRKDRLKRLWDRYGMVLVAAVAAILLAAAGWQLWQNWQRGRAAEETAALAALAERVEGDGAAAAAEELAALAVRAGDGRAGLARFYEAAARAEAGDAAAAAAIYDALSADGSLPRAFRDLATVLMGLHGLGGMDPAVLRARISPLDRPDGPFRFSAREILAVLALREGDAATARRLLDALAADPEAPQGVRGRAAQLAALAGAAPR